MRGGDQNIIKQKFQQIQNNLMSQNCDDIDRNSLKDSPNLSLNRSSHQQNQTGQDEQNQTNAEAVHQPTPSAHTPPLAGAMAESFEGLEDRDRSLQQIKELLNKIHKNHSLKERNKLAEKLQNKFKTSQFLKKTYLSDPTREQQLTQNQQSTPLGQQKSSSLEDTVREQMNTDGPQNIIQRSQTQPDRLGQEITPSENEFNALIQKLILRQSQSTQAQSHETKNQQTEDILLSQRHDGNKYYINQFKHQGQSQLNSMQGDQTKIQSARVQSADNHSNDSAQNFTALKPPTTQNQPGTVVELQNQLSGKDPNLFTINQSEAMNLLDKQQKLLKMLLQTSQSSKDSNNLVQNEANQKILCNRQNTSGEVRNEEQSGQEGGMMSGQKQLKSEEKADVDHRTAQADTNNEQAQSEDPVHRAPTFPPDSKVQDTMTVQSDENEAPQKEGGPCPSNNESHLQEHQQREHHQTFHQPEPHHKDATTRMNQNKLAMLINEAKTQLQSKLQKANDQRLQQIQRDIKSLGITFFNQQQQLQQHQQQMPDQQFNAEKRLHNQLALLNQAQALRGGSTCQSLAPKGDTSQHQFLDIGAKRGLTPTSVRGKLDAFPTYSDAHLSPNPAKNTGRQDILEDKEKARQGGQMEHTATNMLDTNQQLLSLFRHAEPPAPTQVTPANPPYLSRQHQPILVNDMKSERSHQNGNAHQSGKDFQDIFPNQKIDLTRLLKDFIQQERKPVPQFKEQDGVQQLLYDLIMALEMRSDKNVCEGGIGEIAQQAIKTGQVGQGIMNERQDQADALHKHLQHVAPFHQQLKPDFDNFRTPESKNMHLKQSVDDKKMFVSRFEPQSTDEKFKNQNSSVQIKTNDVSMNSDFKMGGRMQSLAHSVIENQNVLQSRSDKKPVTRCQNLWEIHRKGDHFSQYEAYNSNEERSSKISRKSAEHGKKNRQHIDEMILSQHSKDIISYQPCTSKTFQGIPPEWHQTIKVRNPETQRIKLYFKCMYNGCGSIFKKSCNLRDHFRKHTGQRPFKCSYCDKTFTQSGNLGRHLKNVHQVSRDIKDIQKEHNQMHGFTDHQLDHHHNMISINTDSESCQELADTNQIQKKQNQREQKNFYDCRKTQNIKLGKRKQSMSHYDLIKAVSQHESKEDLGNFSYKRPRRSSVIIDTIDQGKVSGHGPQNDTAPQNHKCQDLETPLKIDDSESLKSPIVPNPHDQAKKSNKTNEVEESLLSIIKNKIRQKSEMPLPNQEKGDEKAKEPAEMKKRELKSMSKDLQALVAAQAHPAEGGDASSSVPITPNSMYLPIVNFLQQKKLEELLQKEQMQQAQHQQMQLKFQQTHNLMPSHQSRQYGTTAMPNQPTPSHGLVPQKKTMSAMFMGQKGLNTSSFPSHHINSTQSHQILQNLLKKVTMSGQLGQWGSGIGNGGMRMGENVGGCSEVGGRQMHRVVEGEGHQGGGIGVKPQAHTLKALLEGSKGRKSNVNQEGLNSNLTVQQSQSLANIPRNITTRGNVHDSLNDHN